MTLTQEDIDELEEHHRRLQKYAGLVFYGRTGEQLEINPLKRTKVMLGFYVSTKDMPAKDRVVKPFPDHDKLEVRLKYMLMVDQKPLVYEPGLEDDEWTLGEWKRSGKVLPIPLLHWATLADFSEDDEAELVRCGVPKAYAKAFGGMSPSAREVFKQPVHSIRDKPPALDKVKASRYLQTLAALGTYDPFHGGYFEKWQPDDGTGRARTWPGSLSPEFLKRTASEVLLGTGRDYLLVTSDISFELYAIEMAEDGELSLTSQLGGYETKHGMLDWSRPRTVVLFHSIAGEPKTVKRTSKQFKITKAKPQRLLLDPQRMVEAVAGGKEGGQLLELNDSEDWFVEMCIAYFPSMFYPIDFDRFGKNFERSDSFKMLKDEMDKTVIWLMDGNDRDAMGEKLDAVRRAEVESWLQQEGVIVFPQTMKFGEHTRLIGAENHWIYMRDLRSGAVFAEHMEDFIANYRIGVIATDVYESTRGVIPLVGLLFAVAGVGVGTAVAGAFIGGAMVRKVVTDLTVRELTSRALKRAVKFMLPAIIAYTGKLVAVFFVANDPKNDLAKRWRGFADGFFHGYLTNTLYDQFYKKLLVGVATKGPKEYRTYKMIKQVYAAIDKARAMIAKLEEELDEKSIEEGIQKFQNAATHILQGVALLFPALYYADHQDVDAVTDGIAGASGVEAPEADLFELEAAVQIAEVAKNLKGYVNDVDSLLKAIDDSVALKVAFGAVIFKRDVIAGVMALAKKSGQLAGKGVGKVWDQRPEKMKALEKRATTALKNPTVWLILAGVAVATGVVHEIATGGKGTKAVKDGAEAAADAVGDALETAFEMLEPLLNELVTSWPGSTEERARTHGKLVGAFLGAITFNKFLFGNKAETKAVKDKKFRDAHIGEKWIKLYNSPIVGSAMKNNLKVGFIGPMIAAIFRRYISLFQHLKKHGWPDAPQRTEEALGRLLSVVQDAELENRKFARLALFRTPEEQNSFSLSELVKVVFRLRNMVGKDLKAYLEMRAKQGDIDLKKLLPEEFEAIINAAETYGMPDLVAQYGPQLYVVMSTHLYLALGEIGAALEELFEPFTKSKKGWMTLLKELGLDVGDVDGAVKQYNAAKRDDLQSFK